MDSSAGPVPASPKDADDFDCVLDEQPTHLVPERLLRQIGVGWIDVELVSNPYCYLPGQSDAPVGLRDAVQAFSKTGQANSRLVWVQHPATETWEPFSMSPEVEEAMRRVRREPAEIAKLPSHLLSLLGQAKILVPRTHATDCNAGWKRIVEACRRKFHADGYAAVAGLIHPFQLGELRRYFRRQIRTAKVRLGDGQSKLRYIAHNDPVARFFHVQLTKAISDLVGERVKPSYVYMASYQSGARLERHTDREQCEFSVTLCLDYSPEPTAATPWPLYLDTPRGTATVYQALGDGLLYRGRYLPHYRQTLATGHTSTSIFFHYVGENFEGPLE